MTNWSIFMFMSMSVLVSISMSLSVFLSMDRDVDTFLEFLIGHWFEDLQKNVTKVCGNSVVLMSSFLYVPCCQVPTFFPFSTQLLNKELLFRYFLCPFSFSFW